ncbi:MAG: FtsK/SpoIIIE domain-containing protein [Solirubrobacteraceae bacterium]|nr:FtsK/SpoIIIE domain-containing protein [Solirubrobacteraceae bacterium]
MISRSRAVATYIWVGLLLLFAMGFAGPDGEALGLLACLLLSVLAVVRLDRRAVDQGRVDGWVSSRTATAVSVLWATWAVVASSLITGAGGSLGPGLRCVGSLLVLGLAARRIRRFSREPGADRLELVWGVVVDRHRIVLLAVLAVGVVADLAAAATAISGGPIPLVLGLSGLFAAGWRGGWRRDRMVRQLRIVAANAGRVADPSNVDIHVRVWDDVFIERATVLYPMTSWVAPSDPAPLEQAFAAEGWRATLHADKRIVDVERLPARMELPETDALEPYERPTGLALRLGVTHDEDGRIVPAIWDPDAADPHLLAIGPTKSGKSVLLRCLLAQAIAGRWTSVIADPKGVDYRWAADLPGVALRASGDDAFEAIDFAVEEMHRRQAWMEEHAALTATNLSEVPDNPFPNMLVVVDEMAELAMLGDRKRREQTMAGLGSLARRARFVNIVLVVATQRPDATIIPGEIRGNLGTRVLTGEGEQQHKLMAFSTTDVSPLPPGYPRGRGRLMVGGAPPAEFQAAFIDPRTVIDVHAVSAAGSAGARARSNIVKLC